MSYLLIQSELMLTVIGQYGYRQLCYNALLIPIIAICAMVWLPNMFEIFSVDNQYPCTCIFMSQNKHYAGVIAHLFSKWWMDWHWKIFFISCKIQLYYGFQISLCFYIFFAFIHANYCSSVLNFCSKNCLCHCTHTQKAESCHDGNLLSLWAPKVVIVYFMAYTVPRLPT